MSNSNRYSPTYVSWLCMRKRCTDAGHVNAKHYVRRGITICPRWNDYALFLADMGERPNGLSLERVDNNGNYSPENCRWATHVEQCSNRRSNVFITWLGDTYTLKQWSELLELPYKTLWMRKAAGWPVERMLTERIRRAKNK